MYIFVYSFKAKKCVFYKYMPNSEMSHANSLFQLILNFQPADKVVITTIKTSLRN